MPMPTWDQFMVPVLEVLADGETRRLRDLYGLVGQPRPASPRTSGRR